MRRVLALLVLLLLFPLAACGRQERPSPPAPASDLAAPPVRSAEASFSGTTFFYDQEPYDLTARMEAINSILSITPVGNRLVIACHVGPKNGVYCIFDTETRTFDRDLMGNHLIWYNEDITTAVYSFWSDIYAYDGTVLASLALPETSFIYGLTFSDDHTQVMASIVCDDGSERTEVIDLPITLTRKEVAP